MSDDAVYDLTPFQRAMVLIVVVLATTIYAASIPDFLRTSPQDSGGIGCDAGRSVVDDDLQHRRDPRW